MNYRRYYDFLADEAFKDQYTEADYAFFDKHNLTMYFYANDEAIKQKDLIDYKTTLLMHKLSYKNMLIELREITKALEANAIEYLILKGVAISETYPEPFARVMGDHDILVQPKDFEAAIEALKTLDYIPDEETVTFKDVTLYKEGQLMIELHHAILRSDQEYYAEHFTDALWESRIKHDFGYGLFSVPNPEMHFRYITLHMMKHLKGMGFGIRHLLDFKYFALAHGIDLEKQVAFFNEIGYGAFYRAIATICHFELKMEVGSETWLFPRDSAVVQTLAELIAEIGVFGRDSEKINSERHFERFKTSVNSDSIFKIFMVSLFPGSALLTEHYQYAINNTWLLPIAWGHRLVRTVFSKEKPIKEKLFFFTKDEKNLAEVVYMMKMLGLRND